MLAWLSAFAFTQLIEVPIYEYALRAPGRSKLGRMTIAFGASAVTHPFVWFAFPLWIPDSYPLAVLASETFAVAVEAAYLRAFGVALFFSWSLVANAASFGLAILSRNWLGWP